VGNRGFRGECGAAAKAKTYWTKVQYPRFRLFDKGELYINEFYFVRQGAFMFWPRYRYLRFGLVISVFLLMGVSKASAESAKEQLQGTIDQVIGVLRTIRNPQDFEKNRKNVRQILVTRFDFAAMAQSSLGNSWNDLSGKEREFISTFTDFVENSYMNTLGSYQGEKVVYDGDRSDGKSAEVDTRVVGSQGTPIKIGYKLHLKGEQWMVYDAVIDDISVVGNYRSQFARILRTASLDELMQTLRTKAASR